MDSVRLDKWLWAARFFKTRMLAKQAIESGHVRGAAGERLKPASSPAIGQQLRITRGNLRIEVIVERIDDRRRGAPEARQLYTETADSLTRRTLQKQQAAARPRKRPDKKARRELADAKRRGWYR